MSHDLFVSLAIHIADGYVRDGWLYAGFAIAALLMFAGAWRLREEEVSRIALLSAVLVTASLIRIPLGPTSVHLVLNGLAGILLGWRAALAIPLTLFLQATIFIHGGILSLGVNSCIWVLPALSTAVLFHILHRPAILERPGFRELLVATAVLIWAFSLVFSMVLLATNRWAGAVVLDPSPALRAAWHPVTLGGVAASVAAALWFFRKIDHGPEFPLGLLLGILSVLMTAALNALVLSFGGAEDWRSLVLLVFVAHLPVAVLEGLILGFTLRYLARVKPEMLRCELHFLPSPNAN